MSDPMSRNIRPESKAIIEAPIPKSAIKTRKSGFGKDLSYISGSTVIDLLNKAFDYKWSFTVLEEKMVKSEPKQNWKTKELEPQPPYIQILGRLEVPEMGIAKEQFGTKILLGGASEQEGAAKSAATDSMKKCATLLGIGLELYEEDTIPAEPVKAKAAPVQPTVAKTPAKPSIPWDTSDTDRLKELKAIMDISSNEQLDPYVREFIDRSDVTYKDITPMNVKKFIVFLQKKAESV